MKDDDLTNLLQELGGGGSAKTVDWREYYHAIKSRFWVVLLFLVLSGIGATIFAKRQEPRFQARSVLFLEQEQDRVLKDVKGVREESIGKWLKAPNPAFEGLKPLEVIDRGESDRLWEMVYFLRSGVAS